VHLSKLFHNHRLAQPLLQAAGRAQVANDRLVGLMKQYKPHSHDTSLYSKAKSHLTALIAARDELKLKLRSPAANNSLSIDQIRALEKTLKQVSGWVATGQKFLENLTSSIQAGIMTEVNPWQKVIEKAREQGADIAKEAEALGVTPEQVASMLDRMNAAEVLALLRDVNSAIGGGGGGGSGRNRVATAAAPGDRPIQKLIRKVEQVLDHQAGGSTSADFNATAWLLRWLARPCPALSNRRPAEFLGSENGVNRLLEVIGAMASGSYL
jgi:ABC-type transporter Mla subunit MlaD